MCTVILAHRVFDEFPWLVAANRDERLDRPAEAPQWRERDPAVFAPVDLQEGGTWMGVNAHGVLATLTNRWGAPRDAGRRSRGEIVFDALVGLNAADAVERIAQLNPADFNPFHLLTSDPSSAHLIWSDGETFHRDALEPGIHIVTERSFGAAENARQDFLEREILSLDENGALTPDALLQLLRIRRIGDIDSTCVSMPEWNYGTRSCTVAGLGDAPFYEWWEGAPCEVERDDLSAGFIELLAKR